MSLTKKINYFGGWLDVSQSVSGVVLALFLWTHLVLVASILFGAEAMTFVAKTMELSFLSADGHGYPWVVSVIAVVVGVITLVHVLAAVHKLPLNLQQQRALRQQMQVIAHSDTRLWVWQAATGVGILLLLPLHLWLIGSAPETIGPVGSADRIWNDGVWMIYLPLLLCVELHAAIGVYRVLIKWGSGTAVNRRHRIRKIKTIVSFVFVLVGLASLLAFLPHAT
ncbi:fumarate reductase cytochrome b subunit [Shewanella waksmanii]|uniref:fumarate reductase cytochrome b subunit n=1 Tax=Shewanella waksmanii TaxID=213783 RepID=UPI003736783B